MTVIRLDDHRRVTKMVTTIVEEAAPRTGAWVSLTTSENENHEGEWVCVPMTPELTDALGVLRDAVRASLGVTPN